PPPGPRGHASWVSCVAVSADGTRIAAGSQDKTVRVWEAATGRPLQRLADHGDCLVSVAFSPDGKLLASSSYHDYPVRLWDLGRGAVVHRLQEQTGTAYEVRFSPDGRLLAAAGPGPAVRVWGPAAERPAPALGRTPEIARSR